MAWFSWPKQTKAEILRDDRPTKDYSRAGSANYFFHLEDRPPFSILVAELMLLDPKVTLALAIRNGLAKQAEIEVSEDDPKICAFVESEWRTLWNGYADRILETKHVGFQGFEPLYRQDDSGKFAGKFVLKGLRDFHPRDTRPLRADGRIVGMSVSGIGRLTSNTNGSPSKTTTLWEPKSLWLTYGDRYSNYFGSPLLEHAYPSWYEKYQRGGAIKLRNLRMLKDAWIGDIIGYPSKEKIILPTGETITYRDLCREAVEMRMSGGVMGLPTDEYGNGGGKKFTYTPPQSIDGATQIFEYKHELDDEICEGLEVPSEMISAAESGSGFSGRSIPFIALLALLQTEVDDYARQIDSQVFRNEVRMNFGREPTYVLRVKSLIKTVQSLLGGDEGSNAAPENRQAQPAMSSFMAPRGLAPQSSGSAPRYGALALSDASDSRARVRYERPGISGPRKSPAVYGCVVRGVYYGPGEWIAPETIQLASGYELATIPEIPDGSLFAPSLAKFSCAMFDLPPDLACRVIEMGARIHPDDLAADGVELRPHVTAKWGLHTDSPDDLREILRDVSPVTIELGATSVFEGDDSDVVKIEIISKSLRKLNQLISDSLPHTDTHPDYQPHITIAYVRPGLGAEYAEKLRDLAGRVAIFDRLTFSDRARNRITIPLGGSIQLSSPAGDFVPRREKGRAVLQLAGDKFKEKDHPRDDDGKFTAEAYHGTDADEFDEIDPTKFGSATDEGLLGEGFYLSTDPGIGRGKKRTLKFDVSLNKPFIVSYPKWGADKSKLISDALGLDSPVSGKALTKELAKRGHDGAVLDYSPVGYRHKEIAAFDPKSVKRSKEKSRN